MQRFGRKVVYVVVGDGVEEEQAAKKVMDPRTESWTCELDWTSLPLCCCRGFALAFSFPTCCALISVSRDEGSKLQLLDFYRNVWCGFQHLTCTSGNSQQIKFLLYHKSK